MSSFNFSTGTNPQFMRSTADYDDDDLTGPNFVDHFSLRDPSSTVKFRGARVHIYEAANEQFILEDRRSSKDGDDNDGVNRHTITVKRMQNVTFGLRLLRFGYTLIALLIFGFGFALSFEIIMFTFINMASSAYINYNENQSGDGVGISLDIPGIFLSAPVFLFGLSSLMAMTTTFVSEAWSGGFLIRAVFGAPAILSELLYFIFFLVIPVVTFMCAFFASAPNPWELACYAWLACVAFMFCCFALAIVWCEVRACFQLLSIHYPEDEEDLSSFHKSLRRVRRAILLVQTQRYSGQQKHQYLVAEEDEAAEGGYTFDDNHKPAKVKRSLYCRFTRLACLRFMYDTIDPPKRIYNTEEVRDVLPFVTKHSWGLESAFCSNANKRRIISAKGPSAVTRQQIFSSFACTIAGSLIIVLFIISFLVWFQTGVTTYVLFGISAIVCCAVPLVRGQMAVIQLYTDMNKEDLIEEGGEALENGKNTGIDEDVGDQTATECRNGEEEDCKEVSLYRVWETSRITQPKVWVCYTGILLEFFFLFVLPVSTLFGTRNRAIGIIFVIVAFFSFMRKYFDGAAIISELGSISEINIEHKPGKERNESSPLMGEEKTLVLKARLAEIIGNVSRSDAVNRWMIFFGVLLLFVSALFVSATNATDGLGDRPPIMLVNDYAYASEKSLQYPTCAMTKGFEISVDGDTRDTALGDYAFLSALAYETTNVTGYILPQWFGEGEAVDESALVTQFRTENGNTDSLVYFKLFTFPSVPDLAILAIRGSQTAWDWGVNMQLWSAAGLAQVVKWMLPFGWIWTPILDELVYFLHFIEAEQLSDISYYKTTTAAVNNFRETYDLIRVTGASLGGGLAIITGAQAKVPSVAISGLGVELSRIAVQPQVTIDDINKYVFNFIPDRDYIARVGGRPRQHQEAQCTAPNSSPFGCHSMWRSVCEINYRCGSNGRPVICRCHFQFGYPEPEPIGNTTRSFKEACYEQEQAFLGATGSMITSGFTYTR